MRIHFNLSIHEAIAALGAARTASGVQFERHELHESRSHQLAYDVILSGESPYRINSRDFRDGFAATWDQWGIFLASLFEADPTIKSWAYGDHMDFHQKTGYRFVTGGVDSTEHPDYRRTAHRFEFAAHGVPTWTCKGHGQGDTCTARKNR